MAQTLNRRDLLLLGINRRQRSVDVSCEWLYMKYSDTLLDNTTHDLFDRLQSELRSVETIRLMDSSWLTRQDFKEWLDPIFAGLRARGARIVHCSDNSK
ncbi:MAG TPA: hypothetical protein VFE02_07340 [Candidatus Acidoferrales bacterium]|jgi:hypothetical protein|nr:hypothetical protein [Candidatus Acidoferrales bacterium]